MQQGTIEIKNDSTKCFRVCVFIQILLFKLDNMLYGIPMLCIEL